MSCRRVQNNQFKTTIGYIKGLHSPCGSGAATSVLVYPIVVLKGL